MRILVLRNCAGSAGCDLTVQLVEQLLRHPARVVVVPVDPRALRPSDLDVADGVVLTGSGHNIHSHQDFVAANQTALSHALRNNKPVLAICFGFQCVMKRLTGADPEHRQHCGRAICVRNVAAAPWLPAGTFCARMEHAYYYTNPTLANLPPDVTIAAKAVQDACAQQVQAIEWGPVLATAFHPEARSNTACTIAAFVNRVQARAATNAGGAHAAKNAPP
jgi:GMP synthase-like glutamine amidotransferase